MRAPIRLGLQLPNFNFPGVGEEELFERLAEIASTAERSGFDSLFVMDHLHQIPTVGPPENWMLEGNTILAALAGRTSKLNLGLLVGGVTYRNPALLAKITTTLDVISRGRAILGIGAAWFEQEHVAYGFEFPPIAERFRRLEDALQITRAMFTEERPSFDGHHHSIREVLNNPRPIRGDIPIMVGGSGERKTLRMVAQYADASNFFGDPERVRHLIGVLEDHCENVGRDPAEITKTRLGTLVVGSSQREVDAKLDFLRRIGISEERFATFTIGEPEAVVEQASALLEAGLDALIYNMPDAHDSEAVALAGEALSPLLAGAARSG
jgi:F420-dependent oxidoreductase-like protein